MMEKRAVVEPVTDEEKDNQKVKESDDQHDDGGAEVLEKLCEAARRKNSAKE